MRWKSMKYKTIVVAFLFVSMIVATIGAVSALVDTPPVEAPPFDTPPVDTPAAD